MRNIRRVLICAGLLSMLLIRSAGAAGLSDDEKQAIAWFDSLGFPKYENARWVRVATGQWSQRGNDPKQNQFIHAFLLSDDGQHFTVFTTDGFTRTFEKSASSIAEYERVGFEAANLEQDMRDYLEVLRHPSDDASQRMLRRFGERLGERSELFIIARACVARGLEDVGHDLLVQAAAMGGSRGGAVKKESLTQGLSDDFSLAMIWRAFLDFEDPAISREQLLRTFQDFVRRFPQSEYFARAKETADLLEKMVAEDDARAKLATRPAEQMPVKERVADLIFQLRDQNGHQWSQPGECDIFMDPRGDKSPAAQLAAIGMEAVPQLIDSMEDDRFTRSVGYHRDFYFSHFVLRVGDCAEAIIEKIAGRRFYEPKSSAAAMLKDGQGPETKKLVEQWWADVQRKGEKQVLADAVALGDENSAAQARRLVEKYPDAALAPIVKGVGKAGSDWTRVELIDLAGGIKGEGPVPFLKDQMVSGATVAARVAAARALQDRGNSEALPAMVGEWGRQCESAGKREVEAPESLVQFLLSSNDSAAIDAVSKGIHIWPAHFRFDIIEALDAGSRFMMMGSGPFGSVQRADVENLKPASVDALESLLVGELSDTEDVGGMSGSIDGESFSNPRVCDMAGHVLAGRLPQRYAFKLSASRSQRDAQLVVLENIWRRNHQLALLPIPQPRKIQTVGREQIDPLLEQLKSTDESIRHKAADELLSLGLGALAGVDDALKLLPENDARRAALESVAEQLSCQVEVIEIFPADIKPAKEITDVLDGLKSKPLSSKGIVNILTVMASHPPKGAAQMSLSLSRDSDMTGMTVRIRFTGENADDAVSEWETQESVSLDERVIRQVSSSAHDSVRMEEGWSDLMRTLEMALKSPPRATLEIRVGLIRKH